MPAAFWFCVCSRTWSLRGFYVHSSEMENFILNQKGWLRSNRSNTPSYTYPRDTQLIYNSHKKMSTFNLGSWQTGNILQYKLSIISIPERVGPRALWQPQFLIPTTSSISQNRVWWTRWSLVMEPFCCSCLILFNDLVLQFDNCWTSTFRSLFMPQDALFLKSTWMMSTVMNSMLCGLLN